MTMLFSIFISFAISHWAQAADYPIHMPKSPSAFLFSESVNNQVGFSVNQQDPVLADLFDLTKTPPASNLCGPTTAANLMAYFKFLNPIKNQNLVLDFNPQDPNYVNQVRAYAAKCKTKASTGTLIVDMASCISETFKTSGLSDSEVKVLGPSVLPNTNPDFQTSPHNIGVNDIRDALKKNYGVILELKYFHFDETKTPPAWVNPNGHYVLVVGYDYDESFGDSHITLKIVNPEVNYMGRVPNRRFDAIEMTKFPKKPGVSYPPGTDYILTGNTFLGYPNLAFVRYLILSKPHQTN